MGRVDTSVTAKLPAMLKNQPYGKIMTAVVKLNNLPEMGFCFARERHSKTKAMYFSSGKGRQKNSWKSGKGNKSGDFLS